MRRLDHRKRIVFLLLILFINMGFNFTLDFYNEVSSPNKHFIQFGIENVDAAITFNADTHSTGYTVGSGANTITVFAGSKYWMFTGYNSSGYSWTVPHTGNYLVELNGGLVGSGRSGGSNGGSSIAEVQLTGGTVLWMFHVGNGGNGGLGAGSPTSQRVWYMKHRGVA